MYSIERNYILAILLVIAFAGSCLGNTLRTCYTCKGINCMRSTLNATQQCVDPLDYCVTIFDKFQVVQKGCSLEVPIELRSRCDANTVECHKCNTDRCNIMGQENFMCLQCDSSQDVNCAKNPATIMPIRCGSPTAPNSYCYVKYENNVTKRGCTIAINEQRNCYLDGNCMLCSPGDISACNNIEFVPGTRAMSL